MKVGARGEATLIEIDRCTHSVARVVGPWSSVGGAVGSQFYDAINTHHQQTPVPINGTAGIKGWLEREKKN